MPRNHLMSRDNLKNIKALVSQASAVIITVSFTGNSRINHLIDILRAALNNTDSSYATFFI